MAILAVLTQARFSRVRRAVHPSLVTPRRSHRERRLGPRRFCGVILETGPSRVLAHLSLIVRIGPLLREDVGTLSNYLPTAGSTRAASGQSTQAHVAVLRSNLAHSLSFSESVKFANGF